MEERFYEVSKIEYGEFVKEVFEVAQGVRTAIEACKYY